MKKIYLAFLIAFVQILFTNFSASANDIELPEIPDTVKSYMIWSLEKESGTTYFMRGYTSPNVSFYYDYQSTLGDYYEAFATDEVPFNRQAYSVKNGVWTVSSFGSNSSVTDSFLAGSKPTILFSSSDIYKNSSLSEIKFAKKPVPVPSVPMAETIATLELGEVMTVILSLVGSVISLTVLSLAFRKSWTWLCNLLKAS